MPYVRTPFQEFVESERIETLPSLIYNYYQAYFSTFRYLENNLHIDEAIATMESEHSFDRGGDSIMKF